jgi:TetR/AcrR family transcriptional regulator, transcriptional repressor for nem operon
MGRPRGFSESDALERALDVFWRRGYQGVGLTELLGEMGIARQSLYDTFGNKRQLFIRTIEHYRNTRLAPALALLEREGSPTQNVKDLVRFFEQLALDKRARGCLVANSLVEVGSKDPEIRDLLAETLGLLEKGVMKALTRARHAGELPADRPPRAIARALTNALIGMAVTGRLAQSRSAVEDVYDGTLAMLGGPGLGDRRGALLPGQEGGAPRPSPNRRRPAHDGMSNVKCAKSLSFTRTRAR